MRRLLYVPMMHEPPEDVNDMFKDLSPERKRFLLLCSAYTINRVLPYFWRSVKNWLDDRGEEVQRLYHEGVYSAGSGTGWIEKSARESRPRAIVAKKLLDKGAMLMPTEAERILFPSINESSAYMALPREFEDELQILMKTLESEEREVSLLKLRDKLRWLIDKPKSKINLDLIKENGNNKKK